MLVLPIQVRKSAFGVDKMRQMICMCQHPRWIQYQSGEGTCQNCDSDVTEWMFTLAEMEANVK